MRRITEIIIHCASTKPGMDIGVMEIDAWHRARGFDCVGYHYVIRRDGKLENGRPEGSIGAHCKGHNSNSLGICLVGGIDDAGAPADNYTLSQMQTLQTLLYKLAGRYPDALIWPHSAFANKDCPCFDVSMFLRLIGLDAMDGRT